MIVSPSPFKIGIVYDLYSPLSIDYIISIVINVVIGVVHNPRIFEAMHVAIGFLEFAVYFSISLKLFETDVLYLKLSVFSCETKSSSVLQLAANKMATNNHSNFPIDFLFWFDKYKQKVVVVHVMKKFAEANEIFAFL